MCTLTIYQIEGRYILTHNRDEHKLRELATAPEWHMVGNQKILFPRDGKAGGTWIAGNNKRIVCILNGAFVKHKHNPPYRKSRGLVLLDSFEHPDFKTFSNTYNFDGIEPFTMVCADLENGVNLLKWDGQNVHFQHSVALPMIESSATLYSEEDQKKRKQLFVNFNLNGTLKNENEIFQFHLTGKIGDLEKDLVMKRPNGVETLSITQMVISSSGISHQYTEFRGK